VTASKLNEKDVFLSIKTANKGHSFLKKQDLLFLDLYISCVSKPFTRLQSVTKP
jgi:hypothetical protein